MADADDDLGTDEILAYLRANPEAMAAIQAVRDGDRAALRRALTDLVDQVAPEGRTRQG
jgi:hypothetical protein